MIPRSRLSNHIFKMLVTRPLTYDTGRVRQFTASRVSDTIRRCRVPMSMRPMSNSSSPNLCILTDCWKCGTKVKTSMQDFPTTCHQCGCLQNYSVDQVPDYFTILGQQRQSFDVDLASLSFNMKKLQRQLHPDLFGNKDMQEQQISQDLSSLVNSAIFTLQNPIERALYLLRLRGISLDLENQQTLDSEFLTEVLELNEEVEELSNSEEWKEFRSRNARALAFMEKELGDAFERNDLENAQLIIFRMKYYENLGVKLKELQSKFNVVD